MVAGHGNFAETPPKTRSERRREGTRRRLMRAAYEIIAERGLEGLVIQEITQFADVGYGSFYNHFPSKEAIVEAVTEAALQRILDLHGEVGEIWPGSLESFAMGMRVSLNECKRDRMWGWFLVRSVLSGGQAFHRGAAAQLKRSLEDGVAAGCFKCDDLDMARHIIGGLLLLGTINLVSSDMPEDYENRLVETALKSLSVPADKIKSVIAKPLPKLDLPPFLESADDA